MKKILLILVVILLLCICLISCDNTPIENSENNVEKTPIELLTENEKNLFDALITASAVFDEPSAVRLFEVGDYREGYNCSYTYDIIPSEKHMGEGIYDRVTIRLQGAIRKGETLNHYYAIRLNTHSNYIVDNVQAAIEKAAETDCQFKWDYCAENAYPKSHYESREEYKAFLISRNHEYCTEEDSLKYFGRFVKVDDAISESAEDVFNIAKINKALKYYWDERLGNN